MNLPSLPHHEPIGVKVEKGDRVRITDFRIWLDSIEGDGESRRANRRMHIPSWAGDWASGATFRLRSRVPESSFNIGDTLVSVGSDGSTIDVAFRSVVADPRYDGQVAAERVLDILAADQFRPTELEDPLREHSTWRRVDGNSVLRCVWTERLAVGSSVEILVENPEGEPRLQSSRPPIKWHASHAYFRRSQTTDNLHEAYRNLFLALEALLSDVLPWTFNLSETKWLKQALRRVVTEYNLNLASYLDAAGDEPFGQFVKEQYRARRCALFHAKLGRGAITPGDMASRDELAEATARLGRLYIDLARRLTGLRFAGGGASRAAFQKMASALIPADLFILEEPGLDAADGIRSSASLRLGNPGDVYCLEAGWTKGMLPSSGIQVAGAIMTHGEAPSEGIRSRVCIDLRGVDSLEIGIQIEFTNSENLRTWFV